MAIVIEGRFPLQVQQKANDELMPWEGQTQMLLGLPLYDLMETVYIVNSEFLLLEYGNIGDFIEFFTDQRYPGKVLVDIEDMPHRPDIRGLYYVRLTDYVLIHLNDEPLSHFV